ncbi:uncharacterized protein KIAA0930 homolog isoform X1 [Hydra vulgaris]|uniref:Uncharacterized protein KIAA0930 n=1 Tax=Hydra vulgaris TaxID=6087 RepID=T2MC01_HYDVU|nr:uncharacterized protein KIAA0930 homolog [Hydra vulgaris]
MANSSKSNLLEALKTHIKSDTADSISNDDSFIVNADESLWPSLFGCYFMGISSEDSDNRNETAENQQNDDDMLFYVQSKYNQSGNEIKVFRKTSKNLPGLGDPHINWMESVYLNMIMHDMEYTLTCAICTRLPTNDLKVLYKTSLKVHASHHMRRMDSKGESSDLSYPNIFFIIDSYDEVFESMSIEQEEILCVELSAKYKGTKENIVIFLGSVRHEALLMTYEAKTTIGTKFAQKMSWINLGGSTDHFEYIRMRGPYGKGFAEMRIGLCKNNLVEHNGINRHRNKDVNSSSINCNCRLNENNQIYAPTTASPDKCMKCGSSNKKTNTSNNLLANPVKWFQGRSKIEVPTLSPHLTYVTLPWSRIMKDILILKQKPVFMKDC